MKILFDHNIFYQVYGGASKYFVMMMKALPEGCWSSTALFSCNEYAREQKIMRTFPKRFPGQANLLEHLNRPYTQYIINRQDFDVVHQTDFDNYFYKNLGNKPLVVTFHDANMSTFNPHPEIVARQKKALERADAIIAVSHNTKKDLLSLFDVNDSKVHVIHHGIEKNTTAVNRHKIEFPYILYVGFRAKYKNFDRFIETFSQYHMIFPDIKVVCTSYPFSTIEKEKFAKLNIGDSIINIPANETVMKSLYQNALFFIYPSLYEGFGMPILEAWQNECPVALANASCFPEICQEAGMYFNPNSTEEMLSVMISLTENEDLRKDLVLKGMDRVKLFSWERSAHEHYKVYESLL